MKAKKLIDLAEEKFPFVKDDRKFVKMLEKDLDNNKEFTALWRKFDEFLNDYIAEKDPNKENATEDQYADLLSGHLGEMSLGSGDGKSGF